MKFLLNPSSGIDQSYYDVGFSVNFDEKVDTLKLELYNNTTHEHLNILTTSSGQILHDGSVLSPPTSQIDGFINLFNDDKMNTKLDGLKYVEIEAIATIGEKILSSTALFFNEAFSDNPHNIPFDIHIENPLIDLSKNEPLRLTITADEEKSFHLLIKSELGQTNSNFYIFTKKGTINLEIPAEMLNHDLSLYKNKELTYNLYYMKRHGISYDNVVNEKRILIPNTQIKFTGQLELSPQTRLDPVGRELSYDIFYLSDRYLVPVLKEQSFWSRFDLNPNKYFLNKLLKNDILHLNPNRSVNIPEIGQKRYWRSEESRPVKAEENDQPDYYKTMINLYNYQSTTIPYNERLNAPAKNVNKPGGNECHECARKRQRNSQN